MIFALASALRLARFNVCSMTIGRKWQSNFFIGMPTPAAAIVVLLPVYIGISGHRPPRRRDCSMWCSVYTLLIAFMMVSTIPTYSGKLLGERISANTCCRSSSW